MKAQITIEYLFLTLLVIIILSISLAALFKITENANSSKELITFKLTSTRIYNAIQEVCALGSGNSLKLDLDSPISISAYVDIITFKKLNNTISRNSECDFEPVELEIKESVIVYNEDGEIKLK
ncbi:hypothetical protein HYT84_03860 [Candidatus Micrarchaeota archaeon]|nr:hypothetical protein [Candidatus Micrarchaeota archaeon]